MTEYVLTPGIHWIEALKATIDISRNGTVWVRTDEEIEPVKSDVALIEGGVTWVDMQMDERLAAMSLKMADPPLIYWTNPPKPKSWLVRFAKRLLRLAR